MKKIHILRLTLVASVVASLAGCGTYTANSEVKKTASDAELAVLRYKNTTLARIESTKSPTKDFAQDVNAPWLAGKAIPLSKEMTLPAVLRQRLNLSSNSVDALGRTKITALSPDCNPSTYTLPRLASCITSLIGVPVRVKPDALLPAEKFVQRGGATTTTPTAASAGPGVLNVAPVDMELNTLLDLADAHFGVFHRVTANGTVEIFRIETKVLRIKALAQKVTTKVVNPSGFGDTSNTTYENTATDVLASMKTTLLVMGTIAGTVDINPEAKTVVVTDTPEAIARMETFIDSENKRLNRRVTLVFEQLFVSSKNGAEAAVDWSLLYGKLSTATPNTFSSPGNVGSGSAGSAGFSVRGTGAFSGTTLLINALNEMGLFVTRRTFPISTINGNAATIGLPTVFDYVAQVQSNSVTSTSGTVTAPSVTQKEDKFGVFLTVTPEAHDDGQISISVNMSDRSGTLTPYTVQVGGAGTTIQQRNIQETNLTGRSILRTGVPHVIGGLDEMINTSKQRRLDENAPIILGGSDAINQSQRRIILVVTAVAEDGI